ncbi:hypothetical protein GIB67_043026 [Kingdonia uniflora]|uniref:Uncharacterized protein n=1 Tax=Kingdonia uniflora TaxID=39325 RepID=A0A7J7NT30_9MAGN|nr:hypothetical protein GIB67_043026 [Kingdonia uniflora]
MGRMGYLAMKTDQPTYELLNSDLNELQTIVMRLVSDAFKLQGPAFGSSVLSWFTCISASYLIVTNPNPLVSKIWTWLLTPYIFFSLPPILFNFFRGVFGQWIALISVLIQLCSMDIMFNGVGQFIGIAVLLMLTTPSKLMFMLVVAPNYFAHTVRDSSGGPAICLVIACFLLLQQIWASRENCLMGCKDYLNIIMIVFLIIYPICALVA